MLCNDTDPSGLALTAHVLSISFGVKEHPYSLNAKTGALTFEPGSSTKARKATITYDVTDSRGLSSAPAAITILTQAKEPANLDHCAGFSNQSSYACGYPSWNFPSIEEAQFSIYSAQGRCSYAWMLGPAGGRVKTPCPAPGSKHYIGASLKAHVDMKGVHPLKVCALDPETNEVTELFQDVASPAYLYAPVVYLAKGESYRPGSTNEFLEHSRVVLDKPDPSGDVSKVDKSCDDKTLRPEIGGDSAIDLAAAKKLGKELAGYAMHPWSGQVRGGTLFCSQESTTTHDLAKTDDSGTGVVLDADPSIYPGASVGELGGGHVPVYSVYVPHKYVSYWFFYPYNGFGHEYLHLVKVVELHQGDWEHITVDLQKEGEVPNQDVPVDVDYFQHRHCQNELLTELEQGPGEPTSLNPVDSGAFDVDAGTHPVVYSALGGHASYWDERHGKVSERACGVEGAGDVANKGTEWDTYKSIDDATRQPWWGFTGNWGSKVSAKGVDAKILHFGPPAPGPGRTR